MKKPVVIWIIAALFLVCSFPLFAEGNIGAGVFVLLQHAFNAAAFIFFIELRKNALAFRPVVVLKRYARDGYFDQAVAGIIIAFSFLRLQRGGFGLFRFLRGGVC